MKTTIETTDFIHQTGLAMVSLKEITTELPEGWSEGYSEAECEEMVSRMHAADIEIAKYRGGLNEGKGTTEYLDYVLRLLEDADQEAYLSLCDDIAKNGIDAVAER